MINRFYFNNKVKKFSQPDYTKLVLSKMPKIFTKLYDLDSDFYSYSDNGRNIRHGDPTLCCYLNEFYCKIIWESINKYNYDHPAKDMCGILEGTMAEIISCNSGTDDFEIWYDFKSNTVYETSRGHKKRITDVKKSILDHYKNQLNYYSNIELSESDKCILDNLKWLIRNVSKL